MKPEIVITIASNQVVTVFLHSGAATGLPDARSYRSTVPGGTSVQRVGGYLSSSDLITSLDNLRELEAKFTRDQYHHESVVLRARLTPSEFGVRTPADLTQLIQSHQDDADYTKRVIADNKLYDTATRNILANLTVLSTTPFPLSPVATVVESNILNNPVSEQTTKLNNISEIYGAAGGTSNITELTTSVDTHATAKTADVQKDIAVMTASASVQQEVRAMDAALTNTVVVEIDECAYINEGFKTLTEAGKSLELATASIVGELNATLQPAFNAVIVATGEMVTSVADLSAMMADPLKKLSVLTAIRSVSSLMADGVAAAAVAINNAVSQVSDEFNSMVANERDAIEAAVKDITSFNFLGYVANPSPCAKRVIDAVVNKSAIPVGVTAIIASKEPTLSSIAASNVPPRAADVKTDPDDFTVTGSSRINPSSLSIPVKNTGLPVLDEFHSDDTLNAWSKEIDTHLATLNTINKAQKKRYEANLQWKIDVDYAKLRTDVGYVKDVHPDGNSTDPVLTQQWINLRTENRVWSAEFNAVVAEWKAEELVYDAKYLEWHRRFKYGVHYATNMTRIISATWEPSEITTLLDPRF